MSHQPSVYLIRFTLLLGFLGALLVLVKLVWFPAPAPLPPLSEPVPAMGQPQPVVSAVPDRNTVAAQWDWSRFENADSADSGAGNSEPLSGQFDVPTIYQTLSRIRLDESGNLILDQVVLQALNRALDYAGIEWTEAKLSEFQGIVAAGLPGVAGEQAVRIIGDYYDYLQAKQEWFELVGGTGADSDPVAGFDVLVELRRTYLGEEVAGKLFAQEEAEARYMIQSMGLAADGELDEQEKQRRQQALHEAFVNRAPDIPDWELRYQQFVADKSRILQSGLGEQEAQQQVAELLNQHFTLPEQALAAHLGLDQLP